MTVDLLHELLRSHGEHPLGQVRTAGVRGFIGSDGSVVDAPLWLAISTHRAWLAAVHEGEVRAVAEADREQVRVHRGWLVDEVQVGPWRAPLRASTRASAEGLVARWKAGAPHGDPLQLPEPELVAPERAPAARGADVPEPFPLEVPAAPTERWLRAERTRAEHPFDRPDGKVDRAPVWVLIGEASMALVARRDDGRVWTTPVQALALSGEGRSARLVADARPLRPAADPTALVTLAAADPAERWRQQALHALKAGDARDAVRLVAEGLERGHEALWEVAGRLLFASGDPLRSMAIAVRMLRATPDLPIRALCAAWHPAVDAQAMRRSDADVHFLRGLLRPVLGELEVVEAPAELPWPPRRPDEVFAAALAHLERHRDAAALWADRPPSLDALASLAALKTAAGDPDAGDAWEAAARAHREASSPRAAELLDRSLAVDPLPARHHLRAAWAWAAGEHELARGHWTAAMVLDPDATVRPTLPADAERALAAHAHAEAEPDHEAYAWERAAALEPDRERPWLEAATLYAEQLGDPAHGAELLARWCAHADTMEAPPEPRWPRWCRLAELRRQAGDDPGAVAALREAVRHDPLRPEAWSRAITLGADLEAPHGWWAHVHSVLTGASEGDVLPPAARLERDALDALHPGGTDWMSRMRQQLGGQEPPARSDLVRGLERLSSSEHPIVHEAVASLCERLAVDPPEVYLFRGEGAFGCSAWRTSPPVLLLGAQHLKPGPWHLTPAGVHFLLAVELVHLAADHPVLSFDTDLLGTSRNVYQSFGAYASTAENVVDVLTLVPGVDQVAKLQTIVSLSRRVFATRSTIDKVGGVATPLLDKLGWLPEESSTTSVGRQGLAGAALQFRMQADRAALLLGGDLFAAVDAILRSSAASLDDAARISSEGVLAVLERPLPEALRLTALLQFAASLPASLDEA